MADETATEGRTGPQLTHSQAVNRCRDLNGEIGRLAELDQPTSEEEARFAQAVAEFEETDKWRKHLERQAARATVRSVVEGELRDSVTRFGRPGASAKLESGSPGHMDADPILEPDSVELGRFKNPWDLSEVRTFDRAPDAVVREYRQRAYSAIEKMTGATDRVRQAATNLVERWDDEDGRLSRLVLATSEPTYMRAWSKVALAATRHGTMADLSPEERQAMQRVDTFARAMSLTDNAGGYLVKVAS